MAIDHLPKYSAFAPAQTTSPHLGLFLSRQRVFLSHRRWAICHRNAGVVWRTVFVSARDGNEPDEPGKNESNHKQGFAKNRTEREPKCHGSYSVLSLDETVGTFTHFTVNEAVYFTLANQVQVPA